MKKTPAGVRSTHPKPPTITIQAPPNITIPQNAKVKLVAHSQEDLNPPPEHNEVNHIFCWAALADQIDGTTYTDLTGQFPTMSMENKQYIFVAYYDYTTNAIIVRAITDRESTTIVNAFDDVFTYLENKGFKPRFNVMDNEASNAITKYLQAKTSNGNLSLQMNTATTLGQTPSPSARLSLNMLRTSRIDPTKSAYEVLEGPHDFNRHPWAPPGCRAIIHEPANTRSSWGPRGTGAWYIPPAMDHYRSYLFYVPKTRAYRISASAQFFPAYWEVPSELPTEAAARTAAKLIAELQRHRLDKSPAALSRHQRAIKIINDIYHCIGQQAPGWRSPKIQHLRGWRQHFPATLQRHELSKLHRTHNRVTRNNTPGLANPPAQQAPPKLPTRRSPRINPIYNPTTTPTTSPPVAPTRQLHQYWTPFSTMMMTIVSLSQSCPYRAPSIPNDALQAFVFAACSVPCNDNFLPKWPQFTPMPHLEHFANPVVHPITGETIDKYERLANNPATRDVWTTAFGKELGGLAQGDNKTGAAGTDT
ncbi:hypothetical protein ACHAXN_001668, partial [Cyclotella atomus]